MVLIINILYFLVMLMLLILSVFIVYHIIKYSYDKKASFLMLVLFVSVTGVLALLNVILFFRIPFDKIIPLNF